MLSKSRLSVACLALLISTLAFCPFCARDAVAEDAPQAQEQPKEEAPKTMVMPSMPPMPAAPDVQIPDVVALVEDEVIAGEEYKRAMQIAVRAMAMRGMGDPNRDPNTPPPAFGRDEAKALLERMIEAKIVYVLAKKEGFAVDEKEIDEGIEMYKKRAGSEEKFQTILDAQGLTIDSLKVRMREQMLSNMYFQKMANSIEISDEEIAAEYEKLKAAGQMNRPETADVSHILIEVAKGGDDAAWEEGKKKIDEAKARVDAGEDFAEVAKEVSQDPGSAKNGGRYASVYRGQMVASFEKASFETPIGEVTEPFKTEYGWHIVKVNGRKEPAETTLEEAKEAIANRLKSPKGTEMLKKLLADAKDSMKIEVLLKPEETFPEEPKAEEPKAEEPKPEAPKAEEPAEEEELPVEPS